MLSIASFAAALGAMVAGIFGMNLRRCDVMGGLGGLGELGLGVGVWCVGTCLPAACLPPLHATLPVLTHPPARSRSTLEMSVIGFWGTTGMIVLGSWWVFYLIYKYTKRKRIL